MRHVRPARLLVASILLAACGGQPDPRYDETSLAVCSQGPMVAGMDVSHHQGTIDWTQVHATGFDFAIAKASEGTGFADPDFPTYWPDMKSAGVIRGAYHFFHPSEDGATQADYYLAHVGTFAPGDLPPMLDWEVDDCPSYGAGTCPSSDAMMSGCLSVADQIKSAQAFIDEIKAKTGLTTVIYTYSAFWNCMGNPHQFSAYPLWQASYPSTAMTSSTMPPGGTCPNVLMPWSEWTFWQWTAFGSVNGIQSGPVDFDVFNGSKTELEQFAIQPATPDAGPADAGTTVDAGHPLDAGTSVDAGHPVDAGTPEDAGHPTDAGHVIDAGSSVDAGTSAGTAPASGCASSAGGVASLIVLLALLRRRGMLSR